MQNPDHGLFGGPPPNSPGGAGPGYPERHSVLSWVLLVAALAVGAVVVVGLALWALGLVFSVAGVLVRVALVVAVAALVWRRVTRGRWRRSDY
jgi:hypothetical protein